MPSYDRNQSGAGTVRIKVLRYVWEDGWSGARSIPPWPDGVFSEIFQAANGWSIRDFWLRSTLGRTNLRFDIAPWGVLYGRSHEALKDDRGEVIGACRHQAELDGLPMTGYDHVVAFVHEPPANTGTLNGDAVLDQGVVLLERYHRHIGHLIGFGHTLGPGGDDACCVMGPVNAATPTDVAVLPGVELWRSGRKLAAATLYRYSRDFSASPGVLRVDVSAPRTVTLTAVGEAGPRDPMLAAVATDRGTLTFEYRSEAGFEPAIIAHSIGIRSPDGKHQGIDPVWFEARFPALTGSEFALAGVRVVVAAASPTTVTLTLSPGSGK